VELAGHERAFRAKGLRLAFVSLDEASVNAVLAAKLALPFPVLSDQGGEQLLGPLRLLGKDGRVRPAVVVMARGGQELFRLESSSDVDRPSAEELLAAITARLAEK